MEVGLSGESQGRATGSSLVVVAMLEWMEKLQAGAPAISEQLFSSCRYPRASENSLWQEKLAVRTGSRVPMSPGRALALLTSPPEHGLTSGLYKMLLSHPGRLVGKLRPREELRSIWGHTASRQLPGSGYLHKSLNTAIPRPTVEGSCRRGMRTLTCPHQLMQGWAGPHNSVLVLRDVHGIAESPGPKGPL